MLGAWLRGCISVESFPARGQCPAHFPAKCLKSVFTANGEQIKEGKKKRFPPIAKRPASVLG